MKTWYVMEKAESEDGRGWPKFHRRGYCVNKAIRFLEKYKDNPYVSARVIVYEGHTESRTVYSPEDL